MQQFCRKTSPTVIARLDLAIHFTTTHGTKESIQHQSCLSQRHPRTYPGDPDKNNPRHTKQIERHIWIPAFAGMTTKEIGRLPPTSPSGLTRGSMKSWPSGKLPSQTPSRNKLARVMDCRIKPDNDVVCDRTRASNAEIRYPSLPWRGIKGEANP
jgi:hypothetical protein